MWNGKKKAVTFSYDDGVAQDIRLAEIFNRNGLKCTFNINSGMMGGDSQWKKNNVMVRRMRPEECRKTYQGHEVAVHALTHPHLENLPREEIEKEIAQDKKNLESIFDCEIHGMAYPFGTYNDEVLSVRRENNIRYARTVSCTGRFDIPENFLTLPATCKHTDENLMELARQFVDLQPEEPQLFYVWGHSYEFDTDNNWEVIEQFCQMVGGHDDIFYGTNHEVLSPFYR